MNTFLRVALISVAAVLPARADTPLLDLLAHIPADAADMVYLSDHAVMRAQIEPFVQTTPPGDPNRTLQTFSTLFGPGGIDTGGLMTFADGTETALGFDLFNIDQLAGWGTPPDAPLIITGVADRAADIAAAHLARGFETSAYNGHTVWHRQNDHEINLKRRNEDPFSGTIGVSLRLAVKDDTLIVTRAWPAMHRLLDGGPGLDTNTDAAAILRAGYQIDGFGRLTNAILIPDQPMRGPDPAASLLSTSPTAGRKTPEAAELPGLPPFLRYGLLLWQDGATLTGAIAIPYVRADTAETALNGFADVLARADSPYVRKPFDQLLPPDRSFQVVDTGDRKVLVLAFRQTAEVKDPIALMTFLNNPNRRLLSMVQTRDIGILIGR
ncbi:MAG: hypothetical protein LJE68_14075 [Rhodobacter sp.]|nr:hypothetical protein [Rhodobacter sp.]